MTESNKKVPKVVFIGPTCGKSTYINRLITGEYDLNLEPTLGVEVHMYHHGGENIHDEEKQEDYYINQLEINIWDCADFKSNRAGLSTGYCLGTDFAFCFVTNTMTQEDHDNLKLIQDFELPKNHIIYIFLFEETPKINKNIKDLYDPIIVSPKTCYNYSKPFDIIEKLC